MITSKLFWRRALWVAIGWAVVCPRGPVHAQGSAALAAVYVDVTGSPHGDSPLQAALEQRLGAYRYQPVPASGLGQAVAAAGATQGAFVSTDPAVLDRLRRTAGAMVLVRAYTVQAAAGQRTLDVILVDQGGYRQVRVSASDGQLAAALVSALDTAWRTAPRPLPAAAPPPTAPPPAATPPPASPPPAATPPPAAAPPSAPPAAAQPLDTVVLMDGTQLQGRVTQQSPGQFVVIQTQDGATHTLAWNQTQRVMIAPRAAGATAQRTQVDANTQTGVVAVGQQSGCPPGAPPEQCVEQTNLQADLAQRQAQLSHQVDCAPGSTDVRCQEQLNVGVGQGTGAGLSYSKEEVTAVTERPKSSVNFAVGFGLQVGTSTGDQDFTLVGGTIDLSLNMVFGGSKFPGAEGGSWSGFLLEPKLGVQFMALDAGGATGSTNGFTLGSAAGWQYMSFGTLDPESLKQGGFGFRLGGYAGLQLLSSSIEIDGPFGSMTVESSSEDFSVGPMIGISSLTYNPGTAKLKRFDVNLLLLPTGDFLFFILGISFGF